MRKISLAFANQWGKEAGANGGYQSIIEGPRFPDQVEGAKALGFSLFVKRARVGNNKHIRVRPRFDDWSTRGELMIIDDQITNDVVASILDISGRLKGLGDWRPSAKTPGPFGTFKAKIVS